MTCKEEWLAYHARLTFSCDFCGTQLLRDIDGTNARARWNIPENWTRISVSVADVDRFFAISEPVDVCGNCTGHSVAEAIAVAAAERVTKEGDSE